MDDREYYLFTEFMNDFEQIFLVTLSLPITQRCNCMVAIRTLKIVFFFYKLFNNSIPIFLIGHPTFLIYD